MEYQSPTAQEVRELAAEFDLKLDDVAAARMASLLGMFAGGYEFLDHGGDELPPPIPFERQWRRPTADENPFGAWAARAAIRSGRGGPLSGKRIVVKDNIAVAGLPMANGTAMLADFIPESDAEVVRRLLEAGAEIAGKSVCEFMCLSGGSATAASGPVQNPRKPGYSTGGSSSGSAALVAAGEVDGALGTDQGGSVRIPSSWSGVVGMKATRGVVPYSGAVAMESSIDYIGPLTNDVEFNALLLEVLSGAHLDHDDAPCGHDRAYRAQLGRDVKGLRIGLVSEGFGNPAGERDVDECVREAAATLQGLGASVREVSVPEHLWGPGVWGAVVTDGFWNTLNLGGLGYNHEGVYSPGLHTRMQHWEEHVASMPENARMLILLGRHLARYRGAYYGKARNMVRRLTAAYDRAFAGHDLLLLPTTVKKSQPNPDPAAAGYAEELISQAMGNTINCAPFNATGHPAISIPCGIRDGLPVGLMLAGPMHAEGSIYRVAHAFEHAVNWKQR